AKLHDLQLARSGQLWKHTKRCEFPKQRAAMDDLSYACAFAGLEQSPRPVGMRDSGGIGMTVLQPTQLMTASKPERCASQSSGGSASRMSISMQRIP
ncbi:MAG: hypothetical protein J0I75_10025, partial [Hyphomicrobium sp.]|nr:hypothetical protein [Hyphomicrobium sp.]